jgi:hypothetical protein
MADRADLSNIEDTPKAVPRRRFIKTVIAGSAAVSLGNYLFRASALLGQIPGAGERTADIKLSTQDVLQIEPGLTRLAA